MATTSAMRLCNPCLLVLAGALPSTTVAAQSGPPGFPDPPHQVMLLGTFHFADAGLDEFRPEVDIDVKSRVRQQELEELCSVLARFRPTRIAVEAMPARQPELDRRYAGYLRDEFELPANEIYQIGFRLARRLGHDRVHAIDAERRWYQPYVNPEEYAREHGQGAIVESPWYQLYEAASREEDRLKAKRTIGETLLALNHPERIRMSHGIYLVGTFKAGTGDEYPGADVKTAWYNRNLRIFANIQRITSAANERILVVIGAGHLPILRHCVDASPEYALVEPVSLTQATAAVPVPRIDASAFIREHTRELGHEDGLTGPGLDLLLDRAEDAQFVLLGEPHNTDQVNDLTGMLFEALHDRFGFRHLVTEQDGTVMDRMAAPGVRGDLDAIRELARRHPRALHFRTDSELELLALAGRISDKEAPLWGVDRILDAEPALEALFEATDSEADRNRIREVLDEARQFARGGASDARFITSANARFVSLLQDLRPESGTRAAEILHALRVSREDLMAYETAHEPGDPWGYVANERREELMKTRFLACYRRAEDRGEPMPKALVKLGHWHVIRGYNPGNVLSFGSFLREVARFHGNRALSISIQPVNPPGRHWSITDHPEYSIFSCVARPESWQLVDLEPLRGHVHAGSLEVTDEVHDLIFGFDLLLLMGGTDQGRATWTGNGR